MKKRKIEIGGGGPVVASQGTTLPRHDGGEGIEPLKLVLSVSDEARHNGAQIVERVRQVLRGGRQDDAKATRQLARLVFHFADLVLRVPEFHEYMAWLVANRRDQAVRRILGEARRGRRFEHHGYLVGVMNMVMQQKSCSAASAARIVADRYGLRLAKTARSIANAYSEFKDLYHYAVGYHVPADQLTTAPWKRKER